MPKQIRLFIFEAANEPPSWGGYVAQYWEGIHGIMDRPHVVEVVFPPDSVKQVNLWGVGMGRSLGLETMLHGRIAMGVGCGGHTPHAADLVMAEAAVSLEDFRAALLAGKVSETER